MKNYPLQFVALAAVVGLAVASSAAKAGNMAGMAMGNMEKCYGVARAHHNDCKTAAHACAGHAARSRDKRDFVMVPDGLCKKLAGGFTKGS